MDKPILTFTALIFPICLFAQNTGRPDVFQTAGNTVNKINTAVAVFQPYLLKARQLFYDAVQTAANAKADANRVLNNTPSPATPQGYLPNQNLPVNNPATINNDGSGNWGNQNNGLYGNCLDVLTGTVMGMGDAAQSPGSVDLLFYAPDDGQNTYYLLTPSFARNNSSATYMTQHASDQLRQWSEVNESEVALTKLTLAQFNQIQNNGQIQSAARNAPNYSGYYSSPGTKLDGEVFAVRTQMEGRQIYALVAVIAQIGASGSSGYLKIKIKSSGIDQNNNGQVDVNAYLRTPNQ